MKSVLKVLVGALAVGAIWIPREALALGPVDLEIAAQVGGGTSTVGSGAPNALGLGVGVRAGISAFGFYGGVAAMRYFGDGRDIPDASGGPPVHTYASSTLVGLEGGYNLGLSILTLRPQLGIGYYNAGFSYSNPPGLGEPGSSSGSTSSIYAQPGIAGLVSFGLLFLGADAGLLWVPAVDNAQVAVVLHAQVGIKL